MKLPDDIGEFESALIQTALSTPGEHLAGYIERYWLTPDPKHNEGQQVSARIHTLLRPDMDDHMHDHPWDNISIILAGHYLEVLPHSQDQPASKDRMRFTYITRQPGDVIYRKATDRHRIAGVSVGTPAVSLFIMGPWQRDWGFHTPDGWVYWRDYIKGEVR